MSIFAEHLNSDVAPVSADRPVSTPHRASVPANARVREEGGRGVYAHPPVGALLHRPQHRLQQPDAGLEPAARVPRRHGAAADRLRVPVQTLPRAPRGTPLG